MTSKESVCKLSCYGYEWLDMLHSSLCDLYDMGIPDVSKLLDLVEEAIYVCVQKEVKHEI